MYKAAIYINDYLLLLELISKLDLELPTLEYTIYGSKDFEKTLESSAEGYVVTDLSGIEDAEILILLADPNLDLDDKEIKYIRDFDGTIINASSFQFGSDAEVFEVVEPIRKILRNVAVPVGNTSVILNLPVCIYGKDGVEDLMTQTKDIFTFENNDSSVFQHRIAFNKHFNPIIVGLAVEKSINDFSNAGGDISVRISPLSTVFVVDVFAKDHVGLKDTDGYYYTNDFFTANDVAERDDIVVIERRNGLTFTGDYIRILIDSVLRNIREVTG